MTSLQTPQTLQTPREGLDTRWAAVRRALLVRLDNLGDVLVTTPAIHAIRESLPDAHITLLASPVGAQVGRLDPDVDEVVVYEAPWMDPWHTLPPDGAREQRMIQRLRRGRFDGAIIFTSYHQSSLPAAYLAYLADIPLRVAASIDGPGSLLTTRHKHPERMMHEVERGLDLVGAIGMRASKDDLVLRVPESARAEVKAVWKARAERAERTEQTRRAVETAPEGPAATASACADFKEPLVVVHPGCSMPARTYPWEMYARVVELLAERLGARVALTGAASERDLVARIYGAIRPFLRAGVTPLAGALSFPGLCALIEMARLTITNNTGPMHIAAAVKTPVVALFALTNPPEQWGPWRVAYRQLYHDVPCRICYSRICPYGHECLRLVTPEQVTEAARELLRERGDAGARRVDEALASLGGGAQ
ncbi:MAG TPA: glycosyltransferase family 9 protein [Ktedonobacterales bacterium]|nr:glycosyltransferase family 9 protein [Ktedonobacterales bacterium]